LEQFLKAGSVLHKKGALSRHDAIGLFFPQEKTVNSINYLDMLEFFAVPQMAHVQPNVFFQQDGAPPHWDLTVTVPE
jgi:hypothetical protein